MRSIDWKRRLVLSAIGLTLGAPVALLGAAGCDVETPDDRAGERTDDELLARCGDRDMIREHARRLADRCERREERACADLRDLERDLERCDDGEERSCARVRDLERAEARRRCVDDERPDRADERPDRDEDRA
ncbi:MAG: hypothetical protein R3A51_04760 [Nannocystaceae bacterium]|nr:hypothetical protein [Myxococcales bacterium]